MRNTFPFMRSSLQNPQFGPRDGGRYYNQPMKRARAATFLAAFLTFAALPPSLRSASRTWEAKQAFQKALAAYERQDYGAAKISLALALEAEPNFSEAQILKGLLLYQDGKLEEAEAAMKRAVDLNPQLPKEMSERLEAQAHEVEAGLTVEEFAHFRLQFRGAEHRSSAWEAVHSLDSVYNYLGSRFGHFPPEKIPVIIFTTEEFWEAWKAPFWLGGFFDKRDGKVRVRFDDPPGGEAEMERRLRHEFTHAFVYQFVQKDLPLRFQEGIAQYYAYARADDSFWKDKRLEELRKTMKGAPWITMNQIQEAIEKKNGSPAIMYLAYLESESLVLYIAKDHGESWIPNLLQKVKEVSSFDQAFQAVVGTTPARCMEQLRSSWQ